MNLIKKSITVFTLAVLPALTVVLIIFSSMMAIKISEDQKMILSLMQERERTAIQLNAAMSELFDTKNKLKTVQYKLENAIVPQATLSEAFKEKVSKPVAETTTALWVDVKDGSKAAWNYVFR